MTKLNREFKSMRGVIQSVIDELGWQDEYQKVQISEALIKSFNELGSKIIIKSFENGVLALSTDDSCWKTEIFLRREKIKLELNKILGKSIISEIIVR